MRKGLLILVAAVTVLATAGAGLALAENGTDRGSTHTGRPAAALDEARTELAAAQVEAASTVLEQQFVQTLQITHTVEFFRALEWNAFVTAAQQAAEEAERLALQEARTSRGSTTSASRASSASSGSGGGGAGGRLACIRNHESGGNYATSTGNGYYGAYQFSQSTWESVGGSGSPANASPAEQDARAQQLLSSGGIGHWPNANC